MPSADVVNTASVTSTTADPNSATTAPRRPRPTVTPFADLGVTKTLVLPAGPDVLTAGVPARYALTVTNDGPAVAVGAVLTDVLPDGTTFVSAATPVGTCTEAPAGTLSCALGDLPDGASITILVNIDVAADRTADLANVASVGSPTVVDPNPANDSITVTSPVTVEADLQLSKALQTAPIVAGAPFAYDVVITNNGRSTAVETITFSDTLPSQIDLATVTPPSGCSLASNVLTCSFPDDLPSGDSITFTVAGTTKSAVTNISPNSASIATIDDPAVTQIDPEPANNTDVATGAVLTEADLQLTKTFADTARIAGDGTSEFTLRRDERRPVGRLQRRDHRRTAGGPHGRGRADSVVHRRAGRERAPSRRRRRHGRR